MLKMELISTMIDLNAYIISQDFATRSLDEGENNNQNNVLVEFKRTWEQRLAFPIYKNV